MDEFPNEETALEQTADPNPVEGTGEGSSLLDEGAIQPGQLDQAQPAEENFLTGSPLDPTKLPPEIQPIFKKMQGAYTKRMQDIARVREDAGLVDKFRNDRDFALQTLQQWAVQNGYQIAPVGAQFQPQAQQQQQQGRQQVQAPPQLVEAIKASLPPELQWMAESQAAAQWAATQMMMQPLVAQTKAANDAARGQEWDRLAEDLASTSPGWEEHETEMAEILTFLQGPQMNSSKWGSKHRLLYNLVTSNAAATAQVARRMNAAAKNRPASGLVTGRQTSNLGDRIRTAKTSQDAFRLAAQAAEGATGI